MAVLGTAIDVLAPERAPQRTETGASPLAPPVPPAASVVATDPHADDLERSEQDGTSVEVSPTEPPDRAETTSPAPLAPTPPAPSGAPAAGTGPTGGDPPVLPAAPDGGAHPLLDQLVVAPPHLDPPYRRAAFGKGWIDADGDCHNTRAEVLMAESAAPVTFNPNGCTVATGWWTDPWSGYSSSLASDFEIDHLIPLADAWRSGAWAWTDQQRRAFAQDLDDPWALNALHGPVNTSKSDRSPDSWRPPLESSWCTYATAWAGGKVRWQLTVTSAEHDALRDMLATC